MSERLPLAVRVAERLRRLVDFTGRWAAWLSIPVVLITCIDVVGRKLAYIDDETGRVHSLQLWLSANVGRFFDSTVLQELEWHFHAALFALVLGYGMVYNTHVRIDLIRDHLEFRRKAWLEFIGLTFFMLPYCALVIWFAGLGTLLSFNVIGELRLFGQNYFEILQWITSRLLVPTSVLLICTYIVRVLPADVARAGWGDRDRVLFHPWYQLLRYPVRLSLIAVLLLSTGVIDWLVSLWS